MTKNPGCALDLSLINSVCVNLHGINESVKILLENKLVQKEHRVAWLLKAVTCIDLTTLAGDDTPSNVYRLCRKAAFPIAKDILEFFELKENEITTAAVCVYPSRVLDAVKALKDLEIYDEVNVASVATGFPSGQTPLNTRILEIKYAVENGASEIDIVINRTLVLTGKWEELYDEIRQMKEACGEAHLKTILAVGELDSLTNIYKASLVAMMAGSDFIKTSTGKESVNATLPFGLVMARAINEYFIRTGFKVGLKPAGGIRTSTDAINWFILIKETLGNDWLNKDMFRFGASGLLTDIESSLYSMMTDQKPLPYAFTLG